MAKGKKINAAALTAIICAALAVVITVGVLSGAFYNVLSMLGWLPSKDYEPQGEILQKSAVYFVDCGQGDCEVILSDGVVTVIDTGPSEYAERTYEYIKKLGVEKIDNLVLSHAHEDHIGGARKLIENMSVEKIYMSKPSEKTAPTTDTYINLLKAISKKGLKITALKTGMSFDGGSFDFEVLSPSKEYDDLNNQSAVIRAVYNDISFLFTGDAEKEPINDMLSAGLIKNTTVLKAGHHGSKTSTTQKFLNALKPAFAVISCGKDNKYGHPHDAVLKMLENSGAVVYRTDESGSVEMITNGKTISVNLQKAQG